MLSRAPLILTLTAIASALAVGLAHGSAAGAPKPSNLYVSPNGSGSSCTRAQPCGSFARAYLTARPGQTVVLAGGTYSPQDIPVDGRKASASANVVFRPARGAKVTVGCNSEGSGCIDISGDHVTIKYVHVAYMPPVGGDQWQGTVDTERGSDHVTLVGIDAGSLNAAASNMTVRGGDWGPSIDPHNMRIVKECVNCFFTGLKIHDFAIAQGGHMECLTFEGGTNVTIQNSEFRSCSIFSIFAKPVDPIRGAVIQNNVFWNPRHFPLGNDIKFSEGAGGSCSGIVIRYNVISSDVYDSCGGPITVVGNIQLSSQHSCGPAWDYNLFVNAAPCGSHAGRVSNARFVDAANGNFRLRRGSAAIGRGSPLDFPRFDKLGMRRPWGKRADAGAFEARYR
jgi:hypothetical protein